MNPLTWSFKTWFILGSVLAGLGAVWLYGDQQYKEGYAKRDAEQVALDLAETTLALDTLTGRVLDAAANSAALASNLSSLDAAVNQAKKDIRNVVPPRETDSACNLPADVRWLLNRASGYRD